MASTIPERTPLYELPAGDPIELRVAPLKTSWDRKDAPSQVALRAYLDDVERLAAARLAETPGPLALRLDVGLPQDVDPLFEHDLDNFLHPVITRLGGRRFVSAWATKAPGERSLLRIEPAVAASPERGWQCWAGRTTVSTARERDWKAQIKVAVAGASELPPGPVGLQVSLTVGRQRTWPNLWKGVIDALDPILGRAFDDDEYDPRDGRIVRLGLHVRVHDAVGWDVPFLIHARPADLSWPEMGWLAAMSGAERAAWLAEHERRCTPTRRSRRGHPTAQLDGAPGELRTLEAFRAAVAESVPLVITDAARAPKLHPAPVDCHGVKAEHFVGKVLEREGRCGRYYAVPDAAAARDRWPRLTVCRVCGR
jgi:hypothetical protein